MYYEINVSHRGRHLFATESRSILTGADLKRVYAEIKARFFEPDFQVTVFRRKISCHTVDMEKFLRESQT